MNRDDEAPRDSGWVPLQNALAGYRGRFSDGAPAGWEWEDLADGGLRLSLPNKQQVVFGPDGEGPGWEGQFATDPTTTRLWVNSLRYVPALVEREDGLPVALGLLRSFLLWLRERVQDPDALRSGSLDHQVALQLRAICELDALASQGGMDASSAEELQSLCCEIAATDLRLVDQLELFQENNHGIMAAIGVLHFADLHAGPDDLRWTSRALEFLERAFTSILGPRGVANENTPMYQSFYVDLLAQLHDYLRWRGVHQKALDWCAPLLEAADGAFRQMLLADGSVPPIGDGFRSGQKDRQPLLGELDASPEGLFVHSDETKYFAAVCGNRGVFHKQMDDTAIYLNVAGDDLITDAGMLSYDQKDPVARSVRSQRGHSGLFFEAFDDVDPGKVISYSTASRVVQASMELTPAAESLPSGLTMTSSYKGCRSVRVVDWLSDRCFRLRDSVQSPDGGSAALRRFVLGPKVTVTVHGKHALLVSPEAWSLLCLSGSDTEVRIFRGHLPTERARAAGQLTRGFVALRPYSRVPVSVLELPLPDLGRAEPKLVDTLVNFGTMADAVQCYRGDLEAAGLPVASAIPSTSRA